MIFIEILQAEAIRALQGAEGARALMLKKAEQLSGDPEAGKIGLEGLIRLNEMKAGLCHKLFDIERGLIELAKVKEGE